MNIGDIVSDNITGKIGRIAFMKDKIVSVVFGGWLEDMGKDYSVSYSTVSYNKDAVKKFLEVELSARENKERKYSGIS